MMTNLTLDLKTGTTFLDEQNIKNIDELSTFTASKIYTEINKRGDLEQTNTHTFFVNNVRFLDRLFKLRFHFALNDNKLFNLHLMCLESEIYQSFDHWDSIPHDHAFEEQVAKLHSWFIKQTNESPTKTCNTGFIWEYPWGSLSIMFEKISYGCGIYIAWGRSQTQASKE